MFSGQTFSDIAPWLGAGLAASEAAGKLLIMILGVYPKPSELEYSC